MNRKTWHSERRKWRAIATKACDCANNWHGDDRWPGDANQDAGRLIWEMFWRDCPGGMRMSLQPFEPRAWSKPGSHLGWSKLNMSLPANHRGHLE